jgi:phage host-nuclease inhibitor protein Gam
MLALTAVVLGALAWAWANPDAAWSGVEAVTAWLDRQPWFVAWEQWMEATYGQP